MSRSAEPFTMVCRYSCVCQREEVAPDSKQEHHLASLTKVVLCESRRDQHCSTGQDRAGSWGVNVSDPDIASLLLLLVGSVCIPVLLVTRPRSVLKTPYATIATLQLSPVFPFSAADVSSTSRACTTKLHSRAHTAVFSSTTHLDTNIFPMPGRYRTVAMHYLYGILVEHVTMRALHQLRPGKASALPFQRCTTADKRVVSTTLAGSVSRPRSSDLALLSCTLLERSSLVNQPILELGAIAAGRIIC